MAPGTISRRWRWFSLVFGVLLPAWLYWELWRDSGTPNGLMLVIFSSALVPVPFLAWWLVIGASSRGSARVLGLVFTASGVLAWILALPVLLMLCVEVARGSVEMESLPWALLWVSHIVTNVVVLFGNARIALRSSGRTHPAWSSKVRAAGLELR